MPTRSRRDHNAAFAQCQDLCATTYFRGLHSRHLHSGCVPNHCLLGCLLVQTKSRSVWSPGGSLQQQRARSPLPQQMCMTLLKTRTSWMRMPNGSRTIQTITSTSRVTPPQRAHRATTSRSPSGERIGSNKLWSARAFRRIRSWRRPDGGSGIQSVPNSTMNAGARAGSSALFTLHVNSWSCQSAVPSELSGCYKRSPRASEGFLLPLLPAAFPHEIPLCPQNAVHSRQAIPSTIAGACSCCSRRSTE